MLHTIENKDIRLRPIMIIHALVRLKGLVFENMAEKLVCRAKTSLENGKEQKDVLLLARIGMVLKVRKWMDERGSRNFT